MALDLGALARAGRKSLSEAETKTLLREHGIPTTDFRLPDEDELPDLDIRYPVAVKVSSPTIQHKTEVGGVILDVRDRDELKQAYRSIAARFPNAKVLVEPMEKGEVGAIIGLLHDPAFGIAIMVGAGGIMTELYEDVSFRAVPIEAADADEMLSELRAAPLFQGFRGIKVDRVALVELLVAVSALGQELGEHIDQLDLNPVIVKEKGCVAVDAKLVLRPGAP
jgi:acyl-CoA synthetase (NDP forming)